MNVYDSQGMPLWLGESIGRGGEATVYRVKGRHNQLAKIYEPAPRPNYPHKLAWMIGHPPHNPTRALEHASLAWPAGLLYDARRRLVGYTMPYIQAGVPILEVFNPRRRAETLPQFNRRYLHRAARNLAAALGSLHRSNYVAGDLNESNVLVTPAALVTLIDTDSYQVQEQRNGRSITHYCPVGKFEYTPPELHNKPIERVLRLPEQDAFGLSVLIFQLLMEGNHPFRAQWLGGGEPPPIEVRIAQGGFPYMASPPCPVRPPASAPDLNTLHPRIAELVRRCFVDGHHNPMMRPDPAQWERAIAEAEKSLVLCRRGHYYSNHLRVCPRCPLPSQQPTRRPGRPRPAWTSRPAPAGSTTPPGAPAGSRVSIPRTRRPFSPPLNSWLRILLNPQAGISPPGTLNIPRPSRPRIYRGGVWNWVRPKLYKSFVIGGGLGVLAGALPGAILSAASWSAGEVAAWSLLWALGGVTAGMLRGWKPGHRLGFWVNQHVGWNRFWRAAGLVGGAVGGGLAGLVFGWAIFPVFVGLFSGARVGLSTGELIWRAGNQFGWERIWGVIGASSGAALGGLLAGWLGVGVLGGLSDSLASALANWLVNQSASWPLVWTVVGALGGAFGGAIAGAFTDLFSRLLGLVD